MKTQSTEEHDVPVLACSEIGVVHATGKAGIPVINGSFFKDNPALYSRFSTGKLHFSTYEDERFINELIKYGRSWKERPVIISDDDRAMLLLSEHREKLSDYYRFMLPSKEMVRGMLDKRAFCDLSEEKGLPAPVSFYCDEVQDFDRIKGEVPFPCIIKPAFKQDWWRQEVLQRFGSYKKAIRCESLEDLTDLYGFFSAFQPRVIIQEYVPGEDANLFSLNMYVNENSELKGIYLAQKKRIYPIGAGTGCYVVTVKDKDIVKEAVDIVRKLQLKGLINVQFKRHDETGKVKIMEIHLRNSFWNYIGVAAGMNLAAMYYMDLTGEKTLYEFPEHADDYEAGVKLFDIGKDFRSMLQYRKEGKITIRKWLKDYTGKYVIQGCLMEDPKPIFKNIQFMFLRRVQRLLPFLRFNRNVETEFTQLPSRYVTIVHS